MPSASEIIVCPAERRAEAVALVLADLAPSQRREIAGGLPDAGNTADRTDEPLYVALRDGRLTGAAWGQRQAGNIAVFWPPQLASGEHAATADQLAEAVVGALDRSAIEMMQVVLPAIDDSVIELLNHVGFRHLADLIYLTCEANRFPSSRSAASELEFVAYDDAQRHRLETLIERTYEGSLDCAALNGARSIDEVVNGYQATGMFRPENWLFVRHDRADVGVLLMADHAAAGHWELMYMGLTPEARGRGWGGQITRHAQVLAGRAKVQRIVVAVDEKNIPALRMYGRTGFEAWDRRTVYIRFPEQDR